MPLTLPDALRAEMFADCDARRPEEACGLILGTFAATIDDTGRAARVVPMDNVWPTPAERKKRFSIDPLAQAKAEAEAAREGLELLGFYHSHPVGQAVPSFFDLDRAWSAYYYVIVGYPDLINRECRAWRLDGSGAFVEHELRP